MSRTVASTLVLLGCIGAASAQVPPVRPAAPAVVIGQGRNAQAVLAINGVVVRAAWTDEQIEEWVFGDNASMARRRAESRLATQILDLDRACKLTDAQKTKLQLAGRGDIKRFFDCFEEFKRKARLMQHDEQRQGRAVTMVIRPLGNHPPNGSSLGFSVR
jgi:hypothetical protein